jgi:hypothetical protein
LPFFSSLLSFRNLRLLCRFPYGVNRLDKVLNKDNRRYLFALGNHDWCYPFFKASEQIKDLYYPKFNNITNGAPHIQIKDVYGVSLIAIDNTDYQIYPEQLAILKKQFAKNTPCLLFFHIPIYVDTLTSDVIKVWKYPIMMGVSSDHLNLASEVEKSLIPNETTKEFYRIITEDNSLQVKGIFAGHVHFSHVDTYREGVSQYITALGVMGNCRKITLLPI